MVTDVVEKSPDQIKGIRNTLIWTFGFMALVLGLFFSNFLAPKGISETELRELGYYGFPSPREIEDFQLFDQTGSPVSLENLKGQYSLVFFGFTYCPDVCPTTMGVLRRAMAHMQTRPQVIMISVDPERDTPEVLARYVPSFDPEFIGYTGEFDQIANLATQVNVAFGKVPGKMPNTYTVDHSANLVVIDPNGRYAGFIKAPHQALNIARIMDELTR